jgi:hypothetical protein
METFPLYNKLYKTLVYCGIIRLDDVSPEKAFLATEKFLEQGEL